MGEPGDDRHIIGVDQVDERRTLEAQIEKTTGKKVRASYGLDASLLGGAVVRVGSTIYDGSVKGQLERIKEAISS